MGSSNLVTIPTLMIMWLLLVMVCFKVVVFALGFDAHESISCGTQDIRFPFRIKGRQPQQCGYPGFDVVCSDTNQTLLQLPNSMTLNVNKIDYIQQTLELSHPRGCFQRQLRNLTLSLSASPFQFNLDDSNYREYYFFNCSVLRDRFNMDDYMIPCMSTSTNQIYALPSYYTIGDLPLLFCTKMFNISSIPAPTGSIATDKILGLRWSEPNCKHCESKGNRCGWKHNNNKKLYCFSHRKDSSTAIVTTGSVLGSFFLVLVIGAVFYTYDSYILQKEKQAIIEKFLQDYKALKPTRYSYAEIKRITKNFKDKLGEGAYGTVFQGSISKEVIVAVKILNNSQGNGEDFINEVGIIGRIHHVNIVRLVGFCADGIRRALIYEFLPNCSLQKFINSPDNKQNFLGWQKLHEIAVGIAKGVEYLHQGCDQRILHFDIKPQNVLLDHKFNPKISDFGLAKLCSKDQSIVSMTTARGTLGYIAPEVFSRNFGNVSYKSDIYSYGMMLLETIGGRKITEDIEENNNSHIYYPEWIYSLLEERDEMRIHIEDEGDAKIAKKLAIVGLWCIQWHPVDRPSMQMVVQMLEGDQDTLPIPPNPFGSADPTRTYARAGFSTRQVTQNLEVIQELD